MFRLDEALEKFSDPEILSRFDKIEKACRKRGWVFKRFGGSVIFIGESPRGFEKLTTDLDSSREALVKPFIDKLRTGELVAVGTFCPAAPESAEVKLAPAQWQFLKPLFATEEAVAEGGGLRFVGVRVGRASACAHPAPSPTASANNLVDTDISNPGRRAERHQAKLNMYQAWYNCALKYGRTQDGTKRTRGKIAERVAGDHNARDPITGSSPAASTVKRRLDEYHGWAEKSWAEKPGSKNLPTASS